MNRVSWNRSNHVLVDERPGLSKRLQPLHQACTSQDGVGDEANGQPWGVVHFGWQNLTVLPSKMFPFDSMAMWDFAHHRFSLNLITGAKVISLPGSDIWTDSTMGPNNWADRNHGGQWELMFYFSVSRLGVGMTLAVFSCKQFQWDQIRSNRWKTSMNTNSYWLH